VPIWFYLAKPIRRIIQKLATLNPGSAPAAWFTDAGKHQGE